MKIVFAIGFLCVGLIVWLIVHDSFVVQPRAYRAWIKLTGNPQEITYQDWLDLKNSHALCEERR